MPDRNTPDLDDQIPPDLAGLRNAISCELYAQLALRGESIKFTDVTEVAYAVAVQLRRQFQIEPHAADLSDDDSLGLDSATFHASAMPHASLDRYPIFDHGWPSQRWHDG